MPDPKAEASYCLMLWALLHGWTVRRDGTGWAWQNPGGKATVPCCQRDGLFGTPPADPALLRALREDWRRRSG